MNSDHQPESKLNGHSNKKMTAQHYCDIFAVWFLEKSKEIHEEGNFFQQDNAEPHISGSTKEFFMDDGENLLPWPAKSPDMKSIENIWGDIVFEVYTNFKQYDSEQELLEGIQKAWKKLAMSDVRSGRVYERALCSSYWAIGAEDFLLVLIFGDRSRIPYL